MKVERMRYQENKLSYNLALIAFLLNLYYLVTTMNNLAINYHIGIEIGINLIIFMMMFLGMEKVKKHDLTWSYGFIVLGCVYFARIFYMPQMLKAQGQALIDTQELVNIATGSAIQEAGMVATVTLIVISAIMIVSGVISLVKARALIQYYGKGRRD